MRLAGLHLMKLNNNNMKIMVDTIRHGNKIYDRLSRLSDAGEHTRSGAHGKREQTRRVQLRPILPTVTPLALLALWLAFPAVTPQHSYNAPPPDQWQCSTRAARERPLTDRRTCTRSFISTKKKMNPKNTKNSPIHENADANITCNFRDGDISR